MFIATYISPISHAVEYFGRLAGHGSGWMSQKENATRYKTEDEAWKASRGSFLAHVRKEMDKTKGTDACPLKIIPA